MRLVFTRSLMKTAMDTCKAIAKDKENALVWLLTAGKEGKDAFLYTNRNNQEVKYFHHMRLLEPVEEPISFLVNPHLLEEALKGRDQNGEWTISEDKEKLISGTEEIAIRWFTGKFPIGKMPYTELNDAEGFIETIEMMNSIAGKTVVDFTLGGGEITVRSPIYIKRFSLPETTMPVCTVTPDALAMLKSTLIWKKNDVKAIFHAGNEKELVIKTESTPVKKVKKESVLLEEATIKQLYIFQNQTVAQKVKQLEGELVHTFTVNPDEILEALNNYKKPVEDVYLYDADGKLCIDPYDKIGDPTAASTESLESEELEVDEELEEEEIELDEEYESEEDIPKPKRTKKEQMEEEEEEQPLSYHLYDGNVKRTKLDLEGAIAFFQGFSEKTEEQIKQDEYRMALLKIENYLEREENVLDALKSYRGKIQTVSLYIVENEMLMDPYHKKRPEAELAEGDPIIFHFPYKGKNKLIKADVEELISIIEKQREFRSQTIYKPANNAIQVEIRRFVEEDEEYFFLTSRNSLFYSILMAKKEPNYVKVQRKVDAIFEEQKKIKYL